jgi:plasmid stability protein
MPSLRIRDVPDDVHNRLKMHAAAAGMSLSAYLRRELALVSTRLPSDSRESPAVRRARLVELAAWEFPDDADATLRIQRTVRRFDD